MTKESDECKFIKLEPNPRYLYNIGPEAYESTLAFVRELVQNSIDAGATKVSIEVGDDEKGGIKITIRDDGKGMSYNFMAQDYEQLGKLFSSGGEIGYYGIGRLSMFKPISRVDSEGNIVYNGFIEIMTTDEHSETTKLKWTTLSSYDIEKIEGSKVRKKGTEIVIHIDKSGVASSIDAKSIKEYIKDTFLNPKIKIYVNEELLEFPKSDENIIETEAILYYVNRRDYVKHQLTLRPGTSPGLTVAQTGVVVTHMEFPKSLVADFSQGTHNGERCNIHSYSREKVVPKGIKKAVIDALIKFYEKMTIEEKEKNRQQIAELVVLVYNFNRSVDNEAVFGWWLNLEKRVGDILVIDGKTLNEWKEKYKGGDKLTFCYDEDDDSKIKSEAEKVGFKVIKLNGVNRINTEKIMEMFDIPNIHDKLKRIQELSDKQERAEKYNEFRDPKTDQEKKVINYANKLVDILMNISDFGKWQRPEVKIFEAECEIDGAYFNAKNCIALNINSPGIRDCEPPIIIDVVAHEFTHYLGYGAHYGSFMKKYVEVFMQLVSKLQDKGKIANSLSIGAESSRTEGKAIELFEKAKQLSVRNYESFNRRDEMGEFMRKMEERLNRESNERAMREMMERQKITERFVGEMEKRPTSVKPSKETQAQKPIKKN